MKVLIQTVLLLLGLGFSVVALWWDWLWADIPTPPNQAGFNVKNYTGLEVLGEGGTRCFMTFYTITILVSCIVRLRWVNEEQRQRIFKMLLGVKILIVLAVIFWLLTGSYLESNHVFYSPKTGLLLWGVSSSLTLRWLWAFGQKSSLLLSKEDLLDDWHTP